MGLKRVLGIQIQQEEEKLEKLVEQSEEKDEPALAEGFRALIDWLPELEQKLRSRR